MLGRITADAGCNGHCEVVVRLSTVDAAMAVIDPRGVLMSASPAAAALLSELGTGAPGARIPERYLRELELSPQGEPVVWTTAVASGEVLRAGITRYRLDASRYLLLMRDVGPREQALSQRMHRQRLEATGRLVASVAHDLRAPLSSISLNASVLDTPEVTGDEDRRRALEDLHAATDRMRRSIESLLDYARIGPPVREDFPLRDAVGGVQQLLGALLREGGHSLAFRLAPGAGRVIANRLVLEQILVNLVLNAIEAATGPGRVSLRSERTARDEVSVHIEDDGPGIPPEVAGLVFEPFFSTKPSGTGLGLATARDAARELGGELSLRPAERGAHFVLELPAPEPEEERP